MKMLIIKEEDKNFIKDLSSALRRFISRYLPGEGQLKDMDENSPLEYELIREDLWEEKYKELDLDKLIYEKIKDFKLKVGEAFSFYKIIGKEDQKSIEESKNKINVMKKKESQNVAVAKSESMNKEGKYKMPKDKDNDNVEDSNDDIDDDKVEDSNDGGGDDDDIGDDKDEDSNDGGNDDDKDEDNDDDNGDNNDDDNGDSNDDDNGEQ